MSVAASSFAAEPTVASVAETPADLRGQFSWALLEFARNPYVSLVYMFVFAPYFAATVVGDPVRGQELWSLSYTISGICIAVLAPIIGAITDRLGRRKPWIALTIAVMAPACWLLWYAMPGAQTGLSIAAIAALVILLMIAYELGSVAHNAMLPSIVSAPRVGQLSGLGLACGASGSVVALTGVLFGIALPASAAVSWGFLPDRPWFGLDPGRFEHARVVGPIAAVWMVVFALPMLLWTPDRPATGVGVARAVQEGFAQLLLTLKHGRRVSNVGLFLLARMFYNDATIAIQAYCGIYAAGVFGWDLATIMVFAMILVAASVLGGFVGGRLDARFGSRRAIIIGVILTAFASLAAVSVTPTQLFFMPYDAGAAGPIWSLPYFRTAPELVYVLMYVVLAVTITSMIANSRAMMARIAPRNMMSQFFGLYSLSGTATAFLGHGMVALFTGLFDSQRVGFASLLLLLASGAFVLRHVREERAPDID